MILFAWPLVALAAAPAAPARPWASQVLHDQCLVQAADVHDPWALAHGVTAFGASFVAGDGRRAVDVMVDDFLHRNPTDAGMPLGYDTFARDGMPIEPHPNLITKTLVNAGVPLSQRFHTRASGDVTLDQIVRGIEKGFHHSPKSEFYWREAAWTLDVFSQTHRPGRSTFVNESGETLDVDALMEDGLEYLELADKALGDGMDQGLPEVPKDKQGIYSHTCGGLHLVQAVLSWARFPEVRKKWGKRLDRQLAILFYRLGSESRQYDALYERVVGTPALKLQLLDQMLKFYGHWHETVGRARAEGVFAPSEAQLHDVARARALLDFATRGLEEMKAFQSMDQLRDSQRQVWLDLIGDSCHAAHGFDLWR